MQPLEEGGLQLLYCGDIAACFTKPGAGAPSYFLYLVNLSFGNCTKCRYRSVPLLFSFFLPVCWLGFKSCLIFSGCEKQQNWTEILGLLIIIVGKLNCWHYLCWGKVKVNGERSYIYICMVGSARTWRLSATVQFIKGCWAKQWANKRFIYVDLMQRPKSVLCSS